MKDETTEQFQSGWDMRAAMVQSLFEILQEANTSFMLGYMDKYFWNLNLIKRRIIPYLTSEESIDIKAKEQEIEKVIGIFQIKHITPENKKLVNKTKSKAIGLLNVYDESIMFLLNKYGFLIPSKEDKNKLIA